MSLDLIEFKCCDVEFFVKVIEFEVIEVFKFFIFDYVMVVLVLIDVIGYVVEFNFVVVVMFGIV